MQKTKSTIILKNIVFTLIGIIFLDHFLVISSFLTSHKLLPFSFPLALAIMTGLSYGLASSEGLLMYERFWPVIISIVIMAVSFAFSVFYFDLSWDGQWYHQQAIYEMESGWNPFIEPMKDYFASILHFPKGSWYFATSIYSTFGDFEAGKCLNLIVVISVGIFAYVTLLEFGFSEIKAFMLAILLPLNPVVWSEVTTYLVDGFVILYLTIYIISFFAWLRKPDLITFSIGAMSAVCLINVKFTGLVFLCFFTLDGFIFLLIWKSEFIVKYIGAHIAIFMLAILIFGYNPYITNTVERGNPLYPIMGSAKYPSHFELSGDANEDWETPQNMKGKPILVRYFYALNGRPGNAPYGEQDAVLIWPLTSKPSDWTAYHFHETRVSGFGPYFNVILVLSMILFIWTMIWDKTSRWAMSILWATIIISLSISKHFWWPRFAPQMWMLPIIPVIFTLWNPISKPRVMLSWFLIFLLIVNGSIVLFMHMKWETEASICLRNQLAELQQKNKPIEVAFEAFGKSGEEKLKKWGIDFTSIPKDTLVKKPYNELKSVVEKYPMPILYREKEK
jgi:hypothetical protein